ncbi:MAG: mdtC 3, partial [Phycisphaerales bacterium]|nr:mdtC 3 [Phycisphaerales bacterium]
PPGVQPPLIIQYSASNVPIMQLALSSDTIPEQALFDTAINVVRIGLIDIPGIQVPYPYGGKQRQIVVDLDPNRLYSYGISPADVSAAVNAQNLILPAGSVKIGEQEYQVRLNSSPEVVGELNNLPVKTLTNSDGTRTTVYVKDVASVRDGFQVQTNIVHTDGKRGVLISIYKNGNASTIDVVNAVKAKLPTIQAGLPPAARDLKITPLFDLSVFVKGSITGVITEAVIAAALTGLMILLFLGSWRTTLIVVVSIPLSIFCSILVLAMLGQTLNTMTLGGMALAVGILVDDATVEIENIHRNLHQRKRLVRAILDGAQQIAVPAFVATLCICIVFVPVVFISGAARYLFTPLALAVVFAMMTSYLLSRTLVPTMVHYLLAGEVEMYGGKLDPDDPHAKAALEHKDHAAHGQHDATFAERWRGRLHTRGWRVGLIVAAVAVAALVGGVKLATAHGGLPWLAAPMAAGWTWLLANKLTVLLWLVMAAASVTLLVLVGRYMLVWRVHFAFNRQFEKLRRHYGGLLKWALAHRLATTGAFAVIVIGSVAFLLPTVGQDFFPTVDAGQIRLHVRAPAGTRIEQTEVYFGQVSDAVRKIIPADELEAMLDNIGIANSGINTALSDGTLNSPANGEILIALNENHKPTAGYMKRIRQELPRQFPDLTFFFKAPDISTQVLNFGLSSPIDIQFAGPLWNDAANTDLARQMMAELRDKPGIVDLHLAQVTSTPDFRVNVDRTLADQLGLTQRDVASNLLISLSGTLQAAPNFWLNPKTGITYNVLVQTPQYRVDSVEALNNMPIQPPTGSTGDGGGASGGRTDTQPQLLGNLATNRRGSTPANVTHYNIKRTASVQMNVAGTDLGRAADQVREVVEKYRVKLPKGSTLTLRGQVESMSSSFTGLAAGLVFAIVLVYLLMVINFQSWVDPLIILMALPGAAAGILWLLFVTGTTISVPALMGAIMAVGVATANSILMVTFANDQRKDAGMDSVDAALTAGLTRLRPVLMTALAMILGMLPMSLGFGEGGEQNAPLGRAVIGGLLFATVTTLFFVPVVYSALRRKPLETHVEPELRDPGDEPAAERHDGD